MAQKANADGEWEYNAVKVTCHECNRGYEFDRPHRAATPLDRAEYWEKTHEKQTGHRNIDLVKKF